MTQPPVFADRVRALGVLATAPVVALLAPSPSTSWAALSDAQHPAAPLVGVVALAAWACTAWLALLMTVTSAAHVPGAVGRRAGRVAARLAPASVQGLVRVALGTTVALSVLGGATSAFAQAKPAVTSSFEWPGASSPSASPGPARSATPSGPVRSVTPSGPARSATPMAPVHVVHPAPTVHDAAPVVRHHVTAPVVRHDVAPHSTAGVVVEPGDCLWSIAARALGPQARPAQVAQAWPEWWQANRALLGDDPSLIHPGEHLAAPTSSSQHR